MTWLLEVWNHDPAFVLTALVAFNAALIAAVVRQVKVLRAARSPSRASRSPGELTALLIAAIDDDAAITQLVSTENNDQLAGALHTCFRHADDASTRARFMKIYQTSGLEKFDSAQLSAGAKGTRLRAVRRLSLLGSLAPLFELKRLLDDKDSRIALYAFRAIAKKSTAINPAMLAEVTRRSHKRHALLISALCRIAATGSFPVLVNALTDDLSEWIYVACLKSLAKARTADLVTVLMKAQGHASPVVRATADQLLAKLYPETIKQAAGE